MRNRDVGPRLPRDVRVCGSLGQFWGSIKAKYSRYDERRQYLQEEFEPLPAYLESESTSPVDDLVDDVLTNFSAEEVQRVWKRALERRENDPEAAITSARSLVEAVCKHILDEAGEQYNNQGELKRLYRQAAGSMNSHRTSNLSRCSSNYWGHAQPLWGAYTQSAIDSEMLMVGAVPLQIFRHAMRSWQ